MKTKYPNIILASASPRRSDILNEMGVSFKIHPSDVTEVTLDLPEDTAIQNSYLKAQDISKQHPTSIVLGSDTVVAVGDTILGKPKDEDDAYRMLRLASGKKQAVISGICLLGPNLDIRKAATTWVYMKDMSDKDIWAYIKSGEPFGKAGSYAIQETGDQFVEKIEGSFHNVVGLPKELLEELLPTLA